MTDSTLTAIASVLVVFGFCALAFAASFIVRDRRARQAPPRKRITMAEALTPPPALRNVFTTEKWCGSCNRRVANHQHEFPQRCPACGSELAHVSLVAEAVATPEEPDTMPDGGPGAA